ncbi:MAG: hypothetical protein KDB14_34535 [Planctomycetales bacterium]|nr:hypothetical protein [Planctomycetales bacterium]
MLRLTWRGAYIKRGGAVPGGYEPYDFVLDAIQKMLDGTRPWNKEKYGTVEEALRATIDSDISHLVRKIDNRKVRRLIPQASDDETSQAYEIQSSENGPVQVVIDRDSRDQFTHAARTILQNDPSLAELLDCYEADCTKPAEISKRLGIPAEEVTNLKKRLCRKLSELAPRIQQAKERSGDER